MKIEWDDYIMILSNKNLTTLPRKLFEFKDIEILFLDNNNFKILPEEITYFKELTYIDLSDNLFHSFPEKLLKATSLETLDLSYNNISQIPDELKDLKKLKDLNLIGNPIKDLPIQLFEIDSFKVLLQCFSKKFIFHHIELLTWYNKDVFKFIEFNEKDELINIVLNNPTEELRKKFLHFYKDHKNYYDPVPHMVLSRLIKDSNIIGQILFEVYEVFSVHSFIDTKRIFDLLLNNKTEFEILKLFKMYKTEHRNLWRKIVRLYIQKNIKVIPKEFTIQAIARCIFNKTEIKLDYEKETIIDFPEILLQ